MLLSSDYLTTDIPTSKQVYFAEEIADTLHIRLTNVPYTKQAYAKFISGHIKDFYEKVGDDSCYDDEIFYDDSWLAYRK